MSKKRKFKLVKVFFIILYLLIVILYASLIFGKYAFNDSRSDFNFFGKSFYVLENNDAVLVNYDLKPSEGDTVVLKKNNTVNLAKLDFEIDKKTVILNLDGQDKANYVTVSSNNVFLVENTFPFLGGVYLFLSSIWGCLVVIILPCSLFLIFEVVQIIKLSKNKKISKESDVNAKSIRKLDDDKKSEEKDLNSKLNDDLNTIDQNSSEQITNDIEEKGDKTIEKKSMDDILKNIEYKVAFQDTHQLQNTHRLNDIVDETVNNKDENFNLSPKYGLNTKNIEDGIELSVSPDCIDDLKLILKTDGSLTITTDKYTANIDLDI